MSADDASSIEVVDGEEISIRFDGKKCIHARFCVLQAPRVFKANTLVGQRVP